MLKEILPLIQKVTEGQNLTAEETEKAFTILEAEDLESYFFFAFLAALHAKGESSEELVGFCKANEHFIPSFDIDVAPDQIIDLSGTGGDQIKTSNISTAASFVVASGGVKVAKQAFFAVTGKLGSADLMQTFGVDALDISHQGPTKLKEILKKTNLVVYHALSMADPEQIKGLSHWANKRREIGLNHITIYHLAANAFSPIPMKRRIYGVFDQKYLTPLIKLFQKLGYKKALVFNGEGGLDEVSNIGPTTIYELSESKIKNYVLNPEDFGVKRADIKDIEAKDREGNIADFLRVLYGKEKGPKRDLICINVGAAFYVMDKVSNFKEGTKLATSLIDSGEASSKLEEYVKYCGNIDKLNKWKKKLII